MQRQNNSVIQQAIINKSSNDKNINLFLAPMDGVADFVMREILTDIGGIDFCVSEFLRVTDTFFSDRVFYDHCFEIKNKSKTTAGTPVYFQILGSHPHMMAENALRAVQLGAIGIDLNFGCPAKTVNKNNGGAVLLLSPQALYNVVSEVRKKIPSHIPVSAKIRLGYDDPNQCLTNVKILEDAGASWITVHCRTKTDGYKPPAYWEWIPKIKQATSLPIIVNGEITNVNDFYKCYQETECDQYMIGRASMYDPFIFLKIKKFIQANFDKKLLLDESQIIETKLDDSTLRKLLVDFFKRCEVNVNGFYATARTKQWMKYLTLKHQLALDIFEPIKALHDPEVFIKQLELNS